MKYKLRFSAGRKSSPRQVIVFVEDESDAKYIEKLFFSWSEAFKRCDIEAVEESPAEEALKKPVIKVVGDMEPEEKLQVLIQAGFTTLPINE